MVDFGDDLIIESYRIPWLIWIQFLVMFLLALIILLSYFGFFSLDFPPNNAGDSIISSPPSLVDFHFACNQRSQVSGDHDFREDTPTSATNRVRRVENNSEREGSTAKDLAPAPGSERIIHPCHYFDLAKQAFLKCLGLGSTSRKSRAREHQHED